MNRYRIWPSGPLAGARRRRTSFAFERRQCIVPSCADAARGEISNASRSSFSSFAGASSSASTVAWGFCVPSRGGLGRAQMSMSFRGLTSRPTANGEVDGGNSLSSPSRSAVDAAAASARWRKGQLRSVEDKFQPVDDDVNFQGRDEEDRLVAARPTDDDDDYDDDDGPLQIDSDDELQQMWKDMEGRVLRRRTYTLAERGGVSGRRNVRKTDEEAWLAAGLYGEIEDGAEEDGEGNNGKETDDPEKNG